MMPFVKLVLLISLAIHFLSASSLVTGFVSNGNNGSHRTTAVAYYYRPATASMMHPLVETTTTPTAAATTIRNTQLKMAVIEAPPAAPAKQQQKKQKVTISNDNQSDASKDRGWLVRLYNDPMNKREFVSRCLMEICGLGDGQAYNVMMKAHQTGIAVIGNYPRELAEMYKVKLSGEGLLIDMVPADDD